MRGRAYASRTSVSPRCARAARDTVCGTPDYLARDAAAAGCTRAADFWALGQLLFEMPPGPPFHGQTHSELYRRITRAGGAFPRGRRTPPTS